MNKDWFGKKVWIRTWPGKRFEGNQTKEEKCGGPEVRTTWGRIRPRGFGVGSSFSSSKPASRHKVEGEKPFWIKKEGLDFDCHLVIFHIQIFGLRSNFLGTEGVAYTKMPAGMDSWAPYLPGANLIKDRSTKCLGHPREAYGALRDKKLAVGQDQRATGTLGATEHSQAGSGQGQHVTEVLSLILPALYLGCAIWWDCLAQRPPSLSYSSWRRQRKSGNRQVLPQKSGRQLVDHLSEQAREVASEASMERTPRALAMWMAGLTLAFAISIALAQKVRGYTGY